MEKGPNGHMKWLRRTSLQRALRLGIARGQRTKAESSIKVPKRRDKIVSNKGC